MLVIFPFAFTRLASAVKFALFADLAVGIVMVAHGAHSLKMHVHKGTGTYHAAFASMPQTLPATGPDSLVARY